MIEHPGKLIQYKTIKINGKSQTDKKTANHCLQLCAETEGCESAEYRAGNKKCMMNGVKMRDVDPSKIATDAQASHWVVYEMYCTGGKYSFL